MDVWSSCLHQQLKSSATFFTEKIFSLTSDGLQRICRNAIPVGVFTGCGDTIRQCPSLSVVGDGFHGCVPKRTRVYVVGKSTNNGAKNKRCNELYVCYPIIGRFDGLPDNGRDPYIGDMCWWVDDICRIAPI